MIAEAIQQIAGLKHEATRLVELKVHDERNVHFDQRGEIKSLPKPIPARKHTVQTVESFGAAVERYAVNATAWCVLDKVTCVLNDADDVHRCDVVSLPVTPSDCFKVLESQNWTSQKALIDTLRHSLAAAVIGPENTLVILRNLKFEEHSEQSGEYTNSSAKAGKSVMAKVTGEAALPETVSVEFHPYPSLADEIDVTVVVFCTLFTDPAEGRLKLAPRQGELEKARTTATRALRDTISATVSDIPVFIGTP